MIDAAVCGKCHKDQYESFYKVNYEAAARKEKGVPTGRSPMQDKLLAGHGFTFEHNEPRGHAFMVIDQFVVDRFQGGRFQFKDGWMGDRRHRQDLGRADRQGQRSCPKPPWPAIPPVSSARPPTTS